MSADMKEIGNTAWLLTFASLMTLLITFFLANMVGLSSEEQTIYKTVDKVLILAGAKIYEKIGADSAFNIKKDTKGIRITILSAKLFDINKADIKPEFIPKLVRLANAIGHSMIAVSPGRLPSAEKILADENKKLIVKVRIEGHTDNQIVTQGEFRDNLELSAFRALKVAEIFHEFGIAFELLSAEGRGEYEPIADNRTAEGRALNRRVEIYVDSDIIDLN